MHDDSTKRCNACGEAKLLSEFNSLSQLADGFDYRCRACQRARWKRHYERKLGASERRQRRAEALEARLEAGKKPCSQCGLVKPFSEFHKDTRKPDGLYARCKECFRGAVNAANRQLRQEKPEVLRAKWMRYHARKQGAQTTPVDYEAILEKHGWVCHICGVTIAGRHELHFDHVVPLSRGGAHADSNIRPAHAACNASKGAKLMEELETDGRLFGEDQ